MWLCMTIAPAISCSANIRNRHASMSSSVQTTARDSSPSASAAARRSASRRLGVRAAGGHDEREAVAGRDVGPPAARPRRRLPGAVVRQHERLVAGGRERADRLVSPGVSIAPLSPRELLLRMTTTPWCWPPARTV
jgi:hypothetical protein